MAVQISRTKEATEVLPLVPVTAEIGLPAVEAGSHMGEGLARVAGRDDGGAVSRNALACEDGNRTSLDRLWNEACAIDAAARQGCEQKSGLHRPAVGCQPLNGKRSGALRHRGILSNQPGQRHGHGGQPFFAFFCFSSFSRSSAVKRGSTPSIGAMRSMILAAAGTAFQPEVAKP